MDRSQVVAVMEIIALWSARYALQISATGM